jgi:hypothetical protein
MDGPNYIVSKAVLNGINKGRGGKGSVFVFASGNGGGFQDQCNFDGYTNSIYSVTVASIDYKGLHPYYSEACAANMIVAYSSGSGQHIVRDLLFQRIHLSHSLYRSLRIEEPINAPDLMEVPPPLHPMPSASSHLLWKFG